jgi:predicted AAA+ superfamily ATPase
VREPLEGAERGPLLETWVLHELRAAMAIQNLGGELHYWRTPSGAEVDFIWTRGPRAVGIEVKASARWRPADGTALRGLVESGLVKAGYGVYTGTAEMRDGDLRVMPLGAFLRRLAAGEVLT